MPVLVITAASFVVFSLAIAAMAVGVMAGRRSISGSCGGLANQKNSDGSTSCGICEDPDAACDELSSRMKGNAPSM
jgi:hypothetical protein